MWPVRTRVSRAAQIRLPLPEYNARCIKRGLSMLFYLPLAKMKS
jgi:hypothetical protein